MQQQEKAALMLLGRMQNNEAVNVSNSQQKTYDSGWVHVSIRKEINTIVNTFS